MFVQNPTQRQLNSGTAILRIIAGTIFAAHGAQKLFVFGFAGVSGAFAHMGVPAPHIMGPFVALVELLGGIALVLGLLARLASFGLAIDMLVAILLVHLKAGFFLPQGYEFALSLLGVSSALVFTGAGAWSVDGLIASRKQSDVERTVTAQARRAA